MRKLGRLLVALVLCLSCFGWLGQQAAQAVNLSNFILPSSPVLATAADERLGRIGYKLDLNNSDVRDFRGLRGFFPSLASKIVLNSPYDQVEDALDIPGLSAKQKKRLENNLDKFIVTPPANELNAGDDRLNVGVY